MPRSVQIVGTLTLKSARKSRPTCEWSESDHDIFDNDDGFDGDLSMLKN